MEAESVQEILCQELSKNRSFFASLASELVIGFVVIPIAVIVLICLYVDEIGDRYAVS